VPRISGTSLWPWLHPADEAEVVAGAALVPGDLAVLLRLPDRAHVAHLVVSVDPLRTMNAMGVVDTFDALVVGRVVEVRTPSGRRRHLWRQRALVLAVPRLVPHLKRVPGLKGLVNRLRSASTRPEV
jgi:hypothetical protein